MPYLIYYRVSLPEAVNGASYCLICLAWRWLEPHYRELSVVLEVSRHVVLALGLRGGIRCDRSPLLGVLPRGRCADGAIPIVVWMAHLEDHLVETRGGLTCTC